MNMTVIPTVVGALGTVLGDLENKQGEMELWGKTGTI